MQDNRRRAHRFRDRFDAAQSAPCRSRDTPLPLPQANGPGLTQPHPQFDTVIETHDV